MSLFEARHQFSTQLHIPDSTALLHSHRYSALTMVAAADVPVSSRSALPQSEGCVTDRPSPQHNIRSRACPLHTSQNLRPDNLIRSASPKNKSLTCSRHADLPSFFLVYIITSNFLNYPPSLKFQVKRPPASPSPTPTPRMQIHSKEEGHLGSFYTGFYFPHIS